MRLNTAGAHRSICERDCRFVLTVTLKSLRPAVAFVGCRCPRLSLLTLKRHRTLIDALRTYYSNIMSVSRMSVKSYVFELNMNVFETRATSFLLRTPRIRRNVVLDRDVLFLSLHPFIFLPFSQGYELPLLDLQQEAKLASLLKKNADDAMQRSTVHSSVCNEGYCVEAIGNGIHSRVQNGGDCEEKTANSDRRGSCGTLGTDS